MGMFATMLQQHVTPLSEYQPSHSASEAWKHAEADSRKTAIKEQRRKTLKENRMSATLRAYKDLWQVGEVWLRTKDVESRLGYVRGSALKTLERWEKAKLIEKRPYGNKPYATARGWEWRWV